MSTRVPLSPEAAAFLIEASEALGASVRLEDTLAATVRLCVPGLGDASAVYLVDEGGKLYEAAAMFSDPATASIAPALTPYITAPDADEGLAWVVRQCEPLLYTNITDEMRAAAATNAEHLSLTSKLDARSAAMVPLMAKNVCLGVLALVTTGTREHLGSNDLVLLQELAVRAASGVEQSRLYERLAQQLAARTEAETQQRAERDFLSAVLDNMTDGIVACDMDGRLTVFNGATREIHGLPPTSIAPSEWAHYYSLYHADGATLMRTDEVPLYRALSGEEIHDVQMVIAPRDRPPRTILASGRPLRTRDGAIQGAVVVLRDVTELMVAESRLREAEDRFRKVQRLEMVGQLTGSVAHDFNNLLMAIGSYAELLAADLPAESSRAADVREIQRATERGRRLTRQLLAFSRKDAVRPVLLDLRAVVMDFLPLLRRAVGPRVELRIADQGATAKVLADPGQVEQVVMNLVVNARDAMPAGGVIAIEVSDATREEPGGSRYVTLAVRDGGSGIAPDVLSRLFEPFFTTKPEGVGTGLGLPTVRGIVTQAGGAVEVESVPGEGSTFITWWPAAENAGGGA